MKHLYKELSEDCWELILNQLAIDDFNHLQSPSLVCKLFLSITDRLRLKLNVPNRLFYSHNCEGLFRALQRFTNLQEIELRDPIFGDKADVNYPIQRITSSGWIFNPSISVLYKKPPFPQNFYEIGLNHEQVEDSKVLLRQGFPKSPPCCYSRCFTLA
ncbi:hypothetical protein CsSME_00052638 [Camellia sinensis var. sinensis]